MNREIIYKGLTRPAMAFGVPLVPLFFAMAIVSFLALYINTYFLFFSVPVWYIMREMTKKDEHIFRLFALQGLFATKPTQMSSKKFYGVKTYSAQVYDKVNENFGYPKLSIAMLNQVPKFTDYIPYQSLITDVVITKDFDFMATWQIEGICFEVESEVDIAVMKNRLNMMFRQFSSTKISFYFHNCRMNIEDKLHSNFSNDFLQELDEKYYDALKKGSLKENKLFFTAIFSPLSRASKSSLKKDSFDNRLKQINSILKEFRKYCDNIEANLLQFNPTRLSTYKENDITYSTQLEFYNYLISGKYTKAMVSDAEIYKYLSGNLNNIMFSKTTSQINFNDGAKKFLKAVEIYDYPAESFTGIFNLLMYLNIEYIITQSYVPIQKIEAQGSINTQRKRMISAEDDAVSQIVELDEALDQLSSGEISFGKFHFSVIVFGDTIEQVEKNTNTLVTTLQNVGIMPKVADIALPATYFAQFPANFGIRPRIHTISSANFASFVALHNFPEGRRDGNPWGEAVTILKTPNGQPYYFNFHEMKKKDDFDDKVLANTLIIGQSGGGKTVLMNFLLNQLGKYEDINTFHPNTPENKKKATFFYLDKDKGAMGNIMAIGGKYITIDGGKPTGFNPFQVDNTSENLRKLQVLMKMLVTRNGEILSTQEEEQLNNAVSSVMRLFEKEERKNGISLVLAHLTEGANERNSMKSRLNLWAKDNKFGWCFDNEVDNFNFDDKNTTIYGIDGTDILRDREVSDMVAYYILWRIFDLTDGRRFALFIDEAWDWIRNPVVADEVFNKEKTIRKQNGFLVLGTQSVEDLAKSDIATALIEQSATVLLLSNPKAKEEDYIKSLNMTEEEYEFVVTADPSKYLFLVKQNEKRAIAKIDLSHVGRTFLKILSTESSYIDDLEKINSDDCSYDEKLQKIKKLYS